MESCWALDVDWQAVSQAIGGVGQGLGALAVAVAAFLGLDAWKRQLHGTKNQALAEECLTNAYQLQYMIDDIRRPMAWTSEMDKVSAREGESEESRSRRAAWGVIEVRFAQHADQYAGIVATRFKLQALFGMEVRKAFEELIFSVTRVRSAAVDIVGASRILDQVTVRFNRTGSDAGLDQAMERYNKLESIIFSYGREDDPIATEVNKAISDLEGRLQRLAANG